MLCFATSPSVLIIVHAVFEVGFIYKLCVPSPFFQGSNIKDLLYRKAMRLFNIIHHVDSSLGPRDVVSFSLEWNFLKNSMFFIVMG